MGTGLAPRRLGCEEGRRENDRGRRGEGLEGKREGERQRRRERGMEREAEKEEKWLGRRGVEERKGQGGRGREDGCSGGSGRACDREQEEDNGSSKGRQ